MTRSLRIICPILSVGLLAIPLFSSNLLWLGWGLLLFGMLWVAAFLLHWGWFKTVALFMMFAIGALELLFNFPPTLPILGGIFALCSWDLYGFYDHLREAAPEDDVIGLEWRHLLRLGSVVLIGGSLAIGALKFHLRPMFGVEIVLMFLAVWGFGRVVHWMLTRDQ